MSRTIKRKARGVRRSAAAQGARRKVEKVKAGSQNAVGATMGWLPFTEEQLHRIFLSAALGGMLVLMVMIARMAGAPALIDAHFANLATKAGFEVRRVEVRGVERLNELKVYERVLGEKERSMTQLDITSLRASLLELSWVRDARVSRQLPDTLVIDIVERTPSAVLRKPGRLVLIDEEGIELEPVTAAQTKGQLIVAGPDAGSQVAALNRLFSAAPALRQRVREAEWIGNRRWNLTFDTDQVLALPQGDMPAASALVSFAKLDGINRLLGGKVAVFDMRAPERIYMRIPDREKEMAQTRNVAVAGQAQSTGAGAGGN